MSPVSKGSHRPFISLLARQLTGFLDLKRAMGYRYSTEEYTLRELDLFLSIRLAPDDPLLTMDIVRDFIARRDNESETTRSHRLTLIREVCRFLRLEDPRTVMPDRRFLRIVRRRFVPRVFTRDEGHRFLEACTELPRCERSPIRDVVLGSALPLLYLTGLRTGELLRLTQADVDLGAGTLRVNHTKFGKSRVVPLAPDLIRRLQNCREQVIKHFGTCLTDQPFFPSPRGGGRYSKTALRAAFQHVLKTAGIEGIGGNCHMRLHDLRHSFAVLRLLLWCEQNVDLGAKLPLLATYLGHVGLASSQRYLQLTQDLMGEITRRHQARFGYLINEGRTS
jgi:integrase/recombinase XerD